MIVCIETESESRAPLEEEMSSDVSRPMGALTWSSMRKVSGGGRRLRGRVAANAMMEVTVFWHAVIVNG
eukprot:4494987-Prymnesium_polylepis.1